MKQERILSNGVVIKHLSNKELLNNQTLLEKYIKSWEIGFERTGYSKRLMWILMMQTEVAIACTTNNEVIGGLLRSYDNEKDLYLFNNLFSIRGASSVPIGVPLIKSLLSDKKICIGFPNELARIPYKRAGFKKLEQFERKKLKEDEWQKSKNVNANDKQIDEKITVLPMGRNAQIYMTKRERWRYEANMEDREYFLVKKDALIENGIYAIISHYKPKNIIHILELKYKEKSEALKLLEHIRQLSKSWKVSETNMIVNTKNENDLPFDKITSQPIIGYNVRNNETLLIRDGTNDVY